MRNIDRVPERRRGHIVCPLPVVMSEYGYCLPKICTGLVVSPPVFGKSGYL